MVVFAPQQGWQELRFVMLLWNAFGPVPVAVCHFSPVNLCCRVPHPGCHVAPELHQHAVFNVSAQASDERYI